MTLIFYERRDRGWFKNILNDLEVFYIHCVLPCLISGSIEWQTKKVPLKAKENVQTYCICDGPEDDRLMVRCSNFKKCPKVWYHASCLNMTEVPKGKWHCPCCKKK